MTDFILENAMKQVVSEKTRYNLKEVVSSYNNGNYRAMVVTLYTTVIFDLLNKLLQLKEVYQDEKAKKILEEIQNKQKSDPTSPRWEEYLIEESYKNTHIISAVEKEELLWMKKVRNFAAHPIITFNDIEEIELKDITREMARDLIRKAFEIVLTKDALLGRDITKEIVVDLSSYYNRVGNKGLKTYLRQKYYLRMTQERKSKLFKTLWAYCFITNSDDQKNNRDAYFYGLLFLFEENKEFYLNLIKMDQDKYLTSIQLDVFSDFSKNVQSVSDYAVYVFEAQSRIVHFIHFIELAPEVTGVFNRYIKELVITAIDTMYLSVEIDNGLLPFVATEKKDLLDAQMKMETEFLLFEDDFEKYIDRVTKISGNCGAYDNVEFNFVDEGLIKRIINQADYKGWLKEYIDYLLKSCGNASSYRKADGIIEFISIIREYMSRDSYIKLLIEMNNNSQYTNNNNLKTFISNIEKMYKDDNNKELFCCEEEKLIFPRIRLVTGKNYKIQDILKQIDDNVKLFSVDNLIRTLDDVYTEHYDDTIIINYSIYSNIKEVLTDETRVGYNKINIEKFQRAVGN